MEGVIQRQQHSYWLHKIVGFLDLVWIRVFRRSEKYLVHIKYEKKDTERNKSRGEDIYWQNRRKKLMKRTERYTHGKVRMVRILE
jgi:hypothetical protein